MSRFPDVDWFCDRCNHHLSSQPGFNDNNYTCVCGNCGYKNSISRDNIFDSEQDFKGDGPAIKY